jgi:hypothetical protein
MFRRNISLPSSKSCFLPTSCWFFSLSLLLEQEDGGSTFLRNIGLHSVISQNMDLFNIWSLEQRTGHFNLRQIILQNVCLTLIRIELTFLICCISNDFISHVQNTTHVTKTIAIILLVFHRQETTSHLAESGCHRVRSPVHEICWKPTSRTEGSQFSNRPNSQGMYVSSADWYRKPIWELF